MDEDEEFTPIFEEKISYLEGRYRNHSAHPDLATLIFRNRITILAAIGCLMAAGQSCMKMTENQHPSEVKVGSKNELYVYLDSLEHKYEKACYAMGLANWNSYSKEGPFDLDGAKTGFAKIFGDTSARAIIEEWRARSSSLSDKPLARRLELWHRCFIGGAIYSDPEIAKLENKLQQTITDARLKLGDSLITRAEAGNRLRTERKQAVRHRLWSLTSQISSATAADLIRLVTLRNEKAKQLGFPNFYSLVLHLQAIDEGWLLNTMNELEAQTRGPLEAFINSASEKNRITEFGPWDYDYSLREAVQLPDRYFDKDSVFPVIHNFERGIGFEVDSLPIREVVKDIPYGGLSLAISIPGDSRFLVNPTKGKGFYAVAFHEYGHSLKAVHTRAEYPILKGYEWIPGAQCAAYEEGVADMHGEFTDDSLWLSNAMGVKPRMIERYSKNRSLPVLYRLRRLMKDFFIEYGMYQNPGRDMPAFERECFKKCLLVDLDSSEAPQFAASIWYVSYPCYYQNYVLAGMIATQLQEALSSKFGEEKSRDPRVAGWMISHLYASGEAEEWSERIRDASGKSLEPGAYLRKLGIEVTHNITRE